MNLLAVDTARAEGSVALMLKGEVAEVLSLGAGPGFGEALFGAIEALLARHGVRLAELDGFAAAAGPGSFTGIRIGLSAAKALAEAHGKPLVGVSNLRAVASAAPDAPGSAWAPLLDARRGELFAAVYGGNAEVLLPETAGSWASLAGRLREFSPELVTSEPSIFDEGGSAAAGTGWTRRIVPSALAGSVANLAAREFAAGNGGPPETVDANYIRRPDATPAGSVRAAAR